MLRALAWTACAAASLAAPQALRAQDAAPPREERQQDVPDANSRQPILDDAMDFSQAPVLPAVVAPTVEEIRAAIALGSDYLLSSQNPDGSWGSPDESRPFQVYAPVPGAHHAFQTATTSMCVSALIETKPHDSAAIQAVAQADQWLKEHLARLKRATGDAIYNIWGHAYAIQALVRLHQRPGTTDEQRAEYEQLIKDQLEMLDRYESVDGGWGYYDFRYQTRKPTSDSISFVNAAVLVAMKEAADIGVQPTSRTVERAIAATVRQRKKDFTYLYGEYLKDQPMLGINRPAGSLGRSQACNVALRMWGDQTITDNVLKNWLYRLYVRNGWLSIGRKRPIPHEAWFQVAGYFYYFGHYYAAHAVDMLTPEDRTAYRAHLARIIVDLQEPDGCWWDYPLYGYYKPYGTAYALMTLQRCLPDQDDRGEPQDRR
jgi:hypothetical protein